VGEWTWATRKAFALKTIQPKKVDPASSRGKLMGDIVGTVIFVLLGLLLLIESVLKWKRTHQGLFIGAALLAALAAFTFVFSREWGLLAIPPTLMLRLMASFAASQPAESSIED
jgi:hypothetical protein